MLLAKEAQQHSRIRLPHGLPSCPRPGDEGLLPAQQPPAFSGEALRGRQFNLLCDATNCQVRLWVSPSETWTPHL